MRPAVGDRLSGGPADQACRREFSCDGGLHLDVALGVLCRGNVDCSIAGRDRSNDRSKISRHTLASGKLFDGEQLQSCVSFSPEGETGQRLQIMSA